MGLAQRKAALRRRLLARRARERDAADGPERAARAADAVAARVAGCSAFRDAPRVALYAALPDELPTRPLFEAVRRAGKPALLPRLRAGAPSPLLFCSVARWEDLRPGRYGVPEPPPEAEVVTPSAGDLVLVPGVAFDREGRRLGRGMGYYDRTFPAASAGPRLFGLAFAFQVVEEVPSGERDRRVEGVVTETGCVRVAGGGDG